MALRVQLAENHNTKVFSATKIIIVKNYEDLVKQSSQKFNFKLKNIRLFIAKNGIEIKNEDDYKENIVHDDIMIVVSNGNDFKGKTGKKIISQEILKKINYPPKYPYPGLNKKEKDNYEHILSEKPKDISMLKLDNPNNNKKMHGIFPILEGNVLELIRNIVKEEKKIGEFQFNDYISFDYEDGVMFPIDDTFESAIKKECRGLIISSITGKVLARRFHKFFNINERNEVLIEKIDFTGCQITEKIDGSLVTPVLLDNGELFWLTRKVKIQEVEEFVIKSEFDYTKFIMKYIKENITPMFEWIDNNRIPGMLYYSEKQLILIALRHNITGEYIEIPEDVTIPTAKKYVITDINIFIKSVQESTNREGVVISVPNGEKYKLKSFWYVNMYYAIKSGGIDFFLPEFIKLNKTIKNVPEDKIWFTVIKNKDDVIAQLVSILDRNEANEFTKFIKIVQNNIKNLEKQLIEWVESSLKIVPDIDAINSIAEISGWPDWIVSDIVKKNNIFDKIKNFLTNFTKDRNIKVLEELLDIKWNIEEGKIEIGNDILDIVTFDKCNEIIKDHILTTYFPKKLSILLGVKQVYNDTIFSISDNYIGNEGKIIGMWEQFTKDNIWDLRVDLQPPKKGEYNYHNGNADLALFLVQFGLMGNPTSKPFGTYAGILVPTNTDILVGDLIKAMELSFNNKKIVKLKKQTTVLEGLKVFCDLDGVLVDFEKGVFDLTGRNIDNQSSGKMWQRIFSQPKFFEYLEWLPYGKKLWDDIVKLNGSKPTILTGIPQHTKKQYDEEKKNWCKLHLGEDISVITCKSSEKYKYSTNNHILIDDKLENGKLWVSYGGIFIHHITPERTIYELKKILKKIEKKNLEVIESSYLSLYTNNIPISVITNEWPIIDYKFIAIDTEWDPDSNTNTISIIQIATPDNVYIIDMVYANDVVKEQLYRLFKNKNIIKICFGVDLGELVRIGCDLINIIDLQEVIIDQFNISLNKTPSLSFLASTILKKNLEKTKEIQACNWNERPLLHDQLIYASNDVTVLLELYNKLVTECELVSKNIYYPKNINVTKAKSDFDPSIPVKIRYSGIFLSEQSKKELLKRIPALHKLIFADHVTIKYEPAEYEMRGFKIGDIVSFKVIGLYSDKFIQAVKCQIYGDKNYHITISTDIDVSPNKSNEIKKYDDIENFQLFGTLGIIIENINDPLASLPEKIRKKIIEFVDTASTGESLKFKPNELSSQERFIIHEYASNIGIESKSTGKEDNRALALTIKRKIKDFTSDDNKLIIRKITDPFQFASLNIMAKDGNIRSIKTAGYITDSKIVFHDYKLDLNKKIIILRGVSGSGKSHLAKILTNDSSIICSADNYFKGKDGNYNFDDSKLTDAHTYCYNMVNKYITEGVNTIIIDNTNSTLNEYKKYLELAEKFGYSPVILEIYCKDKEQSKLFASRSSHFVPINIVMKMLSRWETDDNAILLDSYIDKSIANYKDTFDLPKESFNKWLADMKLFHFNKQRRKTHLIAEIGTNPAVFLDVPDKLYNEFLERYIHSGINGNLSDEPKYLIELITSEDDIFKMFFDIDYKIILSEDEIENIVHILQDILPKQTIYVTGCMEEKTGIHLKLPETIVTSKEAVELRKLFVEKLYEVSKDKNWSAIIDGSVYVGCRGIRMLGSRKATKAIDKGRVYKLLFAVDKDGKKYNPVFTDIELLKAISIKP